MASKDPKNEPLPKKGSKSLPTSREGSPTSTKRILKDLAKRKALRILGIDKPNGESAEQQENVEENRRAELERKLEDFSLVERVNDAKEKLIIEQRERRKLEEKVERMESEMKSLKGESIKDLDKTVRAFDAVTDTSFEQAKRIEILSSQMDKLENIEKKFEAMSANIANKIAMQGRDEREIDSDSSDSSENQYEYESPPKIGTRSVKRVETRRSGSKKDHFEALKSLRNLVPYELEDRHPTMWVDAGVRAIREFFPHLSEREIMELLIRRLPKKFAGVNSRGLDSCISLEEFKKRIVAMCTVTPATGSESVVKFLNFVPTKIGSKTETFRALVVEILEEAEPLESLGEDEISEEMKRGFILEKCMIYLPYAIQAEISAKGLKHSKRPLLEDLQDFICSPMKSAEVERHLKTLKGESKGKQIGSVVSEAEQKGQSKKFQKRPKISCARCGSAIHLDKNCNWYPEYFKGQPCGPCRKATGFNLFHSEESCVQSPK